MAKTKPFDNFTDKYDDWFSENEFVYESETEAVKSLLPNGKGIEIGIGTGRFALPLNIKDGLEPSDNMAKIAKKRGLNVIKGVAEDIPIENNKYDFALINTAICFFDNLEKALREIFRILKDDGYVVVGFIDKDSPIGKRYESSKNKSDFYKDADFVSTVEILNLLKQSGFYNFEIVQTIFSDFKKIKGLEPIKSGYGDGSYVVIKAKKIKD